MENKVIGSIYQSRENMNIDTNGCVTRPEIGLNTPSGDWKITGAVRFNNFGYIVERVPFSGLKELNGKWYYKNGKQKWHLRDLDHGTNRTWMCPNHQVTIY